MNKKLKKYIDYDAMYDVAVMESYVLSFQKLHQYIGASESDVLMIEKGMLGVNIDDFNFKGKIVTYHDPEGIKRVGKRLSNFLLEDTEWDNLIKRFGEYVNSLDGSMNIKNTNDIFEQAKSKGIYLELYKKYYDLYLDLITLYLITDGRYHEFSIQEIKSHKVDEGVINKLTLSEKESSFQKANNELLEISKLYQDKKLWEERFEKFLDKYIWLYLANTNYDIKLIVNNLKNSVINPEKDSLNPTREETKSIDISTLTPEDKKLLERLAELGIQRMELRKCWQWIDYVLHTLLYAFAKENNLPEKSLCFLSDEEVKLALGGKSERSEIIQKSQKRSECFAALLTDGKLEIYDDENTISKLKETFVAPDDQITVIKGRVSYKSQEPLITGVARVVTWSQNILNDLQKVVENEILVVTQTHPNFVPFLKKVKAIVGDEGGITSHVSVISRELKIPAIVGTRIGTDSIKTGDMIELNMETGEVKIIN